MIRLWLLLPVLAGLVHLLWGARLGQADELDRLHAAAAAAPDPAAAAVAWQELRQRHAEVHPDDHAGAAAATLAWVEAANAAGQLPEVIETLTDAVDAAGDASAQAALRRRLATAHYHASWLLRQEGAEADEWLAEAEQARQHLRLLAQDDVDAARELETVIAFERTDASLLQGLPLPKSCPNNCDDLAKRRRQQRRSRCNEPKDKDDKDKDQEKDARQQLREQQQQGATMQALDTEAGS